MKRITIINVYDDYRREVAYLNKVKRVKMIVGKFF